MAAAVRPEWPQRRNSFSKVSGRTNASAGMKNAASTRSVPGRLNRANNSRGLRAASTIRSCREGNAVKYIRYTKYTGEPGGGVDLQELVKRLVRFFPPERF